MEPQDSRNVRYDGSQLAFSMVLRELVVAVFPNETERVLRGDLLCETLERQMELGALNHDAGQPAQVALSAIEALFAPNNGLRTPSDRIP